MVMVTATQKLLLVSFCLLILLLTGNVGVEGSSHHHHHHHHHHHQRSSSSSRSHSISHVYLFRPTKLFVFGDSYADTGNNRVSMASSWKVPYGITFPGKPSGRFSDGRVLTDFIAKYFGLRSPIPYRWRKLGGRYLKYGMNFAYGGTGVFNTWSSDPNMTIQIDYFQQLITGSVFTFNDTHSSVALVTLSGNDYSTYMARNGSAEGLPTFIASVVNQLVVNLKRIHGLGVQKIAVAGLQPLGCSPSTTFTSSFQKCNDTLNVLVGLHNQLLQQAVAKLNTETSSSTFIMIDLYNSFMSVFTTKGRSKFQNPLNPCCVGVSKGYDCGSVDANGTKKYSVCSNPNSTFFWDMNHPTQEGWRAVYSVLGDTLKEL